MTNAKLTDKQIVEGIELIIVRTFNKHGGFDDSARAIWKLVKPLYGYGVSPVAQDFADKIREVLK